MDPVPQSLVDDNDTTSQSSDEEDLYCDPAPLAAYKQKTVKTVKTVVRESRSYLATTFLLLFLAPEEVFCTWIGAPPPSVSYDRRVEPLDNNNNNNNNNSPASLQVEFEDFVRRTERPQRLPSPFIRGRPSFPSPPSSPSSSTTFSRDFPFASVHPRYNEVVVKDMSPVRMVDGYQDGPGGCQTKEGAFQFAGETWYSSGCRRNKCLHFRGRFFVETDSCDTEFYNTVYKCIVVADTAANYPDCCPRYMCNPDNLGYSTK